MNNELIEKQQRALLAHMKDYQNASQLSKKGQAVIFTKHKQPNGEFGPGLKQELKEARIAFAKEWGINGWRNEHFIKNMIAEAQRPTEAEMDTMHRQHVSEKERQINDAAKPEHSSRTMDRQQFRNYLAENAEKQKNSHKPKMG